MVTQQQLKELLRYDPLDGSWAWRVQRRGTARLDDPHGCPVGHVDTKGRLTIGINKRVYRASRLAWLYMTGEWPNGRVYPLDGDPGNMAFANLGVQVCNGTKRPRKRPSGYRHGPLAYRRGSSGVRGVSQEKGGQWIARVTLDGRRRFLGRFVEEQSAIDAVLSALDRAK